MSKTAKYIPNKRAFVYNMIISVDENNLPKVLRTLNRLLIRVWNQRAVIGFNL